MNKYSGSEPENKTAVQSNARPQTVIELEIQPPPPLIKSVKRSKSRMNILIPIVAVFIVLLFAGFYYIGNNLLRPVKKWVSYQNGIHLVFEVIPAGNTSVNSENTYEIASIMKRRMREFGLRNNITMVTEPGRITVQLPEFKKIERLINLLTVSALLEFKLVDETGSVEKALDGDIKPGTQVLYSVMPDSDSGTDKRVPYLVNEAPVLTGSCLKDASVSISNDAPCLAISLNNEGADKFERISEQNIGRRLAIILDDCILTAPVIREKIPGGQLLLNGRFTIDECRDLAIALRASAGGYPLKVRIVEERELTEDIWLGK